MRVGTPRRSALGGAHIVATLAGPSGAPQTSKTNPPPGASASAAISETSGGSRQRGRSAEMGSPGMDVPGAYVNVCSRSAAPSCSITVSSASACFRYCSAMR
jgi:hypothetical protein